MSFVSASIPHAFAPLFCKQTESIMPFATLLAIVRLSAPCNTRSFLWGGTPIPTLRRKAGFGSTLRHGCSRELDCEVPQILLRQLRKAAAARWLLFLARLLSVQAVSARPSPLQEIRSHDLLTHCSAYKFRFHNHTA